MPRSQFRVIDHTDSDWAGRFAKMGRENGAHTYSVDIVRHHVDAWRQECRRAGIGRTVIGTCGLLNGAVGAEGQKGDLAIQYLHRYPQAKPVPIAARIASELAQRFSRVLFVVSHRALVPALQREGLSAVFVPMTIDAKAIRREVPTPEDQNPSAMVWFGNITHARAKTHATIMDIAVRRGYTFTTLSLNKINGKGSALTQQQLWQEAAKASIGVGVARSALELMALGLPVMIAGNDFGGIVTNDGEWDAQTDANFGGQVVTHSRDIEWCLNDIDQAIRGRTNDIPRALSAIEGALDMPQPKSRTNIIKASGPRNPCVDLVWVSRPGPNEELRYSMRSIVENLPHKAVWVIAENPPVWLDRSIVIEPPPRCSSKSINTTAAIRAACHDQRISDPFVLVNDDFYLLDILPDLPNMHRGQLSEIAKAIEENHPRTPWASGANATFTKLRSLGHTDPMCYETHTPLIIHKAPMLEALDITATIPSPSPWKRTIYGNLAQLGGEQIDDKGVLVTGTSDPTFGTWLATRDDTFPLVAAELADRFPTPSPYETTDGRRT